MPASRWLGVSAVLLVAACTGSSDGASGPSAGPAPSAPTVVAPPSIAESEVPLAGFAPDPETGYVVPLSLVRPLAAPSVGASCPRLPARTVNPAFGRATGPGPVYAVGLSDGDLLAVIPAPGSDFAGQFGGQKVLWVIDAAYDGPVLIRGGPIGGAAPVRFGRGASPAAQMQLPPASTAGFWRDVPSYTRVRTAGCYFWQVDGTAFSYSIVFRVPTYPA